MKLFPLVLAAFGVLTGCVAETEETTAETGAAITSGRIVVKQLGNPGPAISKWGYDIKQDGRARAMKPALAKELFVDTGLNMLRIPVRAADAHPARGAENIKKGEYADDIDAIKMAKAARPDLDIFASVKLLGKQSFPAWVKEGGEVDADKYAALLENYLAFMKDNGVTVDWLGVDNESKFNEGNITPAKYNRIVADVKAFCKAQDIKVPGFIAAENYGPSEDTPWLQNLWQSGAQFGNVDHVGVHIYSKHRDAGYVSAMDTLANNIHGKGLWDSELHWNDLDEGKDGVHWDDIKPGMLSTFDHFDQGFHALSWWAFQPRSAGTKSAFIMSELVSTTVGSQTLATDDVDGKDPAGSKFNSRAFKNDANHVTLWVANFDNRDRNNQSAEIGNAKVTAATWVQWSPTSAAQGKTGTASLAKKDPSAFSMNYPANTITRVTVTLN